MVILNFYLLVHFQAHPFLTGFILSIHHFCLLLLCLPCPIWVPWSIPLTAFPASLSSLLCLSFHNTQRATFNPGQPNPPRKASLRGMYTISSGPWLHSYAQHYWQMTSFEEKTMIIWVDIPQPPFFVIFTTPNFLPSTFYIVTGCFSEIWSHSSPDEKHLMRLFCL